MAKFEMTELDQAFEKVLLWKAQKMVRADYSEAIGLVQADEQSFKVGAVDAMVFDVATLIGFTKKTNEHLDWTSHPIREQFLGKIFG